MSIYVLMEMAIVAIMASYLCYHTRLVFLRLKYRNAFTGLVIILIVLLSLWKMIFFGFLVNACICFMVFDLFNLILFKTKFDRYFKFIYQRGIVALVISLLVSGYGIYNVDKTIITNYQIEINKEFKDKTLLVISDIHLGTAIKDTDLTKIYNHVEAIKPDGVVLLGDIYDEYTTSSQIAYSLNIFKNIATNCPVYFVEGNHEIGFQGRHPLKDYQLDEQLKKAGVTVLMDESILLDDVYLVGRKDYAIKSRSDLKSLTTTLDETKPIVVLDHQPKDYQMAHKLGVDLELSGHTHAGQIFPLMQFYDLVGINEMNYGLRVDDDFHAIVSSGMGTWGYAMRTSKHSEILVVNLISKGGS